MSWISIVAPAWLAGTLLVLLSAPLGCLVLWRRMAFFSDTLAHGALLGVALAVWLGFPPDVGMAVISVVVVALIGVLSDKRLPSDALLAAIASSLLCLGLLTLTQLTQRQANVLGFLFGSLLEITWQDLPKLAAVVVGGLLLLGSIWHAQIKLATDTNMAVIAGISEQKQRFLFMGLLAGFCAVALQAVGSLLISALLILPALNARLFARSPAMMAVLALVIGQIGLSLGIWGSVWLDIQTGLAVVLVLVILFVIGLVVSKLSQLHRPSTAQATQPPTQ